MDLDWEREWWGTCGNTFHEEQKQIVYAQLMGLRSLPNVGHPPTYDLKGLSVVDLGGGPVSLLLKCENSASALSVVDPCAYPDWVKARYEACGIAYFQQRAEDFHCSAYDEVWLYNVLQHVEDPEKVVAMAKQARRVVRVFEWIDIPAYQGHPHELKADVLADWFDGSAEWDVYDLDESGAVGRAFAGCFP